MSRVLYFTVFDIKFDVPNILVVFSSIFVADTKIIFRDKFGAPLTTF